MWVVELLEESVDAAEVAVYDVEVVDVWASEEEGQAYVPVGLFACAEDDDVVNVLPLLKQHCAREGGAESSYLFGVEQGTWTAVLVEERQTAFGSCACSACERLCGFEGRYGGVG